MVYKSVCVFGVVLYAVMSVGDGLVFFGGGLNTNASAKCGVGDGILLNFWNIV